MAWADLEQYLREKHEMGIINMVRGPTNRGNTRGHYEPKIIFTTTAKTYFTYIRGGMEAFWCVDWPFTVNAQTESRGTFIDVDRNGEECTPDTEIRLFVRYTNL